jgi:hypothetical protein
VGAAEENCHKLLGQEEEGVQGGFHIWGGGSEAGVWAREETGKQAAGRLHGSPLVLKIAVACVVVVSGALSD